MAQAASWAPAHRGAGRQPGRGHTQGGCRAPWGHPSRTPREELGALLPSPTHLSPAPSSLSSLVRQTGPSAPEPSPSQYSTWSAGLPPRETPGRFQGPAVSLPRPHHRAPHRPSPAAAPEHRVGGKTRRAWAQGHVAARAGEISLAQKDVYKLRKECVFDSHTKDSGFQMAYKSTLNNLAGINN